MATGPAPTGPAPTGPAITGCSAYDRLNDQLTQSYVSYKKLCQDGELGKHPGMYVRHQYYDDETKPAKHTSDYLRGGVISTMATFEAFVGDLINDATDLVAEKYNHKHRCEDAVNCDLKNCNSDMCENRYNKPTADQEQLKLNGILVHHWDTPYKTTRNKKACGEFLQYLTNDTKRPSYKSLIDVMLDQQVFDFKYKIRSGRDPPKESPIKVSTNSTDPGLLNKCFICFMLRFCYGIRCVMAHGNPDRTFSNALKNFPNCDTCKADCPEDCSTCKALMDTGKLAKLYNEFFKLLTTEEDKKYAESMVRRIPKKADFETLKEIHEEHLTPDDWEECFKICDKYFTNPDATPLPAAYALFHMLRIYYWLVESKRDMYITYGMFERITQFIHTLAFRMYLAVAELLIDNYPKTGKKVWGVEKSNIKTMIEDFKLPTANVPLMTAKDILLITSLGIIIVGYAFFYRNK